MTVVDAAVSFDDVVRARRSIAGIAAVTPVLDLGALAPGLVGKAEHRQHTGSFKYRGATSRLASLPGVPGVVAYSSGNHGAAVAAAAARRGIPACVVVPLDAAPAKVDLIRDAGARLVRYDVATTDRAELAGQLADELGYLLVPPYDDPHVIAGQGTVGLELLEQVPGVDVVVVPVGGGGLIAGVATAIAGRARVVGVEPDGADDTVRSLRAGRRVRLEHIDTVADGLRTPMPGSLTFPIVSRLVDDIVTVPDDAIREAMRLAWTVLGERLEPSGATALAAVLHGTVARGRTTAVVLTGGNIDPASFDAMTGGA